MPRLARKRKQLRLTQSAIADLLGIARQSYAEVERRGIRNVDMAARYASRLGCRPEEIIEPARMRTTKQ